MTRELGTVGPTTNSLRQLSPVAPLAALAYASAHVGYEYFNGGVRTHHFVARGDLPGFSNWLGLVVLPLLGLVFAIRARSARGGHASGRLPRTVVFGLAGALAYGAALAASFHFGFEQASVVLFFGLVFCSLVLPTYRIEYIFGFVVGMTLVFGSVIPLCIALGLAALSFAVRRSAAFLVWAIRKPR